jgi:hypothetical protein
MVDGMASDFDMARTHGEQAGEGMHPGGFATARISLEEHQFPREQFQWRENKCFSPFQRDFEFSAL